MPKVRLEGVIFQLSDNLIMCQRQNQRPSGLGLAGETFEEFDIPEDTPSNATPKHYHGYRRGKIGACADVLAYTLINDNEPAAILTRRKKGVCFERMWWMQGGAVDKAASLTDFVARCAEGESGSRPKIEALIGLFRTSEFHPTDQKRQVSTIQPAYIGYVAPEDLVLKADEAHTSAALMTETMYKKIPDGQKHWYPTLLMDILFRTMPSK